MFNPRTPIESRAQAYNDATYGTKYPSSQLQSGNGMLWGTWFLGNNYKGSGFYGSYPPQYLQRLATLFPDEPRKVMHLFSGSLPMSRDYTRVDLIQPADHKVDAHELSDHFDKGSQEIIYADPPYHKEAAKKYGVTMPDRRAVMNECGKILMPGGYVIWLDTVWPMVAKVRLKLVGTINIYRSSNHVVRGCFIYRKPFRG